MVNDNIRSIAVDKNNNLWVGTGTIIDDYNTTGNGLSKFNGSSWTSYTESNSGLSYYQDINCIAIDNNNNVWIGTDWGISVYKQGK